jgi:uncharacterized protein YxjI
MDAFKPADFNATGFDVGNSFDVNTVNVALKYQYPIDFTFKLTTLHDDFLATDATGQPLAYVKQKIFALKTAVDVFSNSDEQQLNYRITADKWLAFNICYSFNNAQGQPIGKILRQGVRSIWSATYEICDSNNTPVLTIKEANPWVKVLDSLLSEIPIVGLLTGYFFHPKYVVNRLNGDTVFACTKQPSLFGRKFKLVNLLPVKHAEEELAVLGLMMMLLIEKRRG